MISFTLLGALQRRGIVHEIFPEIVNIFDLPCRFDVVMHSADFGRSVGVFDRHPHNSKCLCGLSACLVRNIAAQKS